MQHVVDTSALLDNPFCASDPTTPCVIPPMVVKELDYLKDQKRTFGRARAAIRQLKLLAQSGQAEFPTSIGIFQDADDEVIAFAKQRCGTVLTSDLGLYLKAQTLDVCCLGAPISFPDVTEATLEDTEWGALHAIGSIRVQFPANACILFRKASSPNRTALGLVNGLGTTARYITKTEAWGVTSKNMRQHFLLNMLLDPSIEILTVAGSPGSGKSYLTVAAALAQIMDSHQYHDFVITRPFVEAGPSLGHLPGELHEKMAPWMEAITEIVREIGGDPRYLEKRIKPFTLTHARGRTVNDALWLIDEAQNYSHEELKTLLTRAGSGTKVVITGDVNQSDREDRAGGMQAVVSAYAGEPFYGHISLEKTYRGNVCRVAMDRM